MTEAELIESLNLAAANAFDGYTLFVTFTFGYLTVAYFIGRNLSRLQVFVVSALYVTSTAIFAVAAAAHTTSFQALAEKYSSLVPSGLWFLPWFESSTILAIGGILASLYFMFDIRRPKME